MQGYVPLRPLDVLERAPGTQTQTCGYVSHTPSFCMEPGGCSPRGPIFVWNLGAAALMDLFLYGT